tara:strand:- start:3366 stop:3482 length:117 start_codon:yes stop_codon:yes gene_type:complete
MWGLFLFVSFSLSSDKPKIIGIHSIHRDIIATKSSSSS